MSNYAYRGKGLERAIRKLFESYESRGIHCQQNHPEQLHDGTLVGRHGFDFQILHRGKFFAFDAKECALNTWPINKAKLHQLKALLEVHKNFGEAFFLVYFTTLKKLVKFPAVTVQNAMTDGMTSLPPERGIETTLDILNIGETNGLD